MRLQLLEAVPIRGQAFMKAPCGMGNAFLMGVRRGDVS